MSEDNGIASLPEKHRALIGLIRDILEMLIGAKIADPCELAEWYSHKEKSHEQRDEFGAAKIYAHFALLAEQYTPPRPPGATACAFCGRWPAQTYHIRVVRPSALGGRSGDEHIVPLCRKHKAHLELQSPRGFKIDPLPLHGAQALAATTTKRGTDVPGSAKTILAEERQEEAPHHVGERYPEKVEGAPRQLSGPNNVSPISRSARPPHRPITKAPVYKPFPRFEVRRTFAIRSLNPHRLPVRSPPKISLLTRE